MTEGTHLIVVTVTDDVEGNPEYAADTAEYPGLLRYVEDETETFVLDPESGDFWTARVFFDMENVRRFKIIETHQ